MAENYNEVTPDTFAEKVLQASQLVVVNFSAEQSNACKIQEPEIEAISKGYQDRVIFTRLDVTGQEDLTREWKVEGIPTLIFFKNGHEVHRITGIVMRDKLRRMIEGVLLAE
ncbi:thioredoxin family protein [Dictyobacter aurantiacus]|uniref:Thioredoxin n=1 Tax=Dictyobacter aurantiacus TaxID=1936993 RepID=A0A401ZHW3_9CHLR|nr:thioredoxin family protein [Dictyobacter aurantiacus]GCE06432.1 thioredoxin [Dictyobacter aurantiacus]